MAMSVLAFPKQYPFATNMIIASGKTSVADLIVQCAVEKKKLEEVNWTRNAAFVAFGFAYLGGFQYWIQINMCAARARRARARAARASGARDARAPAARPRARARARLSLGTGTRGGSRTWSDFRSSRRPRRSRTARG